MDTYVVFGTGSQVCKSAFYRGKKEKIINNRGNTFFYRYQPIRKIDLLLIIGIRLQVFLEQEYFISVSNLIFTQLNRKIQMKLNVRILNLKFLGWLC